MPLHSVRGVILAGTYSWAKAVFDRLERRPLLPIANRPLISYAISWLRGGGVTGITVCGNRETRPLEPYIARHAPDNVGVTYREDSLPRGAAGCLRDAADAHPCEAYVVTDASAVPASVDLPHLLDRHWTSRAEVTVVVYSEPPRHGTSGAVVPVGIYVVNRSALDSVAPHRFVDMKEHLLPKLYNSGARVLAYETRRPVPRVLNAETYLAVNAMAVESLVTEDVAPAGHVRCGEVLIHAEARIAPDAVVVGPVLIGQGAQIHSGAVVVGPTSIGCDAVIKERALVSRSAVWRRSTVEARATLDLCIVGDGARIATAGRQGVVAGTGRPEVMQ
jgi:mannose-1-phosphate guanylyltransferase/phosphomannomutase